MKGRASGGATPSKGPSSGGGTPSKGRASGSATLSKGPQSGGGTPSLPRFADIRGHEHPIGFLRRAWEGGRLAHAYLFTGPSGVGKLTTARALALGTHCDVAPFEACGACPACRTIAAGTHPDVRTVRGPLRDRRDISIDQIRELQRELGYRSLSAHPKVGIINDAELLTVQAQNALLKTLEEPSGECLLVLVGVNAANLTPTVLSRCQRLAFSALGAADVAAVLERHGVAAADAVALAAFADGSPGRALTLDTAFFTTRRAALLARLRGLASADFARLSDFARELASDEQELQLVLAVIASFYRDALRRRALGPAATLQNADLSSDLPRDSLEHCLRNLETTYATMTALRQNANRNLALVEMMLRLRG